MASERCPPASFHLLPRDHRLFRPRPIFHNQRCFGRHRPILLCNSCGRDATIKSAVSASPPQNCASSSVAGQTSANLCHQKPNGSTTSAIKSYAIKSKNSKHKPTEHAFVSRSIFAPSLITSDESDPEHCATAVSRPRSGRSTEPDRPRHR
jgi:hypothetical protein